MKLRLCLALVLLACCKKQETEYGSVCRVEDYYLAQDASGRALEIADARRAIRVVGFPVRRPTSLTFYRDGAIDIAWEAYDVFWTLGLEYKSGSPKAKILSYVDGGIIGEHPIRVEGSPPKSVTLAFPARICSPESERQACAGETEEKIVFATYRCTEEQWEPAR